MAMIYNRRTTGLFDNGAGQKQDNSDFTAYSYVTSDSLSNGGCLACDATNVYGPSTIGSQYIPVDTSKNYQFAVSAKGTALNYLGNLPGGHLGFACYNVNKTFLSLQGQKGIGETTLTRATNTSDTSIYIADGSSWYTGATQTNAYATFFPAGTDYSIDVGGSTFFRTYTVGAVTDIGGSEWRVDLTGGLPAGYAFPIGTPVSNGRSGGSYNYALGNPNHAIGTWTTYTTPVFTGESRNSTYPFRFGTKFIKFLNLRNYNTRTQNAGISPTYLLDNIIFVERPDGSSVPTSFLSSDRIR